MEAFRFSPRENRAGDIEWREWGAGPFEEARAAGKPVLLSISAVWCHWCHVMDETSLSDEGNIKLINERYVPIRVDADRRPDIQDRYLMGGWPTIAALSAAGGILAGGTYMPPDGLARWLDEVAEAYQERAEEIEVATAGAIAAAAAEPSESRGVDPHLVRLQLDVLMDVFDDDYGGFGREPKFPNHPAMELLAAAGGTDRETRYGRAVTDTLDRMMGGGLWDGEWGGFFRYSTTRDWSIPHFEKMLSDQAGQIRGYVAAHEVGGPDVYLQTARRTAEYVLEHLTDTETGAFFGSQDADEEFYGLDAAARAVQKEPLVDPVSYTAWSAEMVSALASLARADDDERWTVAAKKGLDRLIERTWDEERGVAHVDAPGDDEATVWGLLEDAARLAQACVDLGRTEQAMRIVGWAEKALRDDEGGFLDRAGGEQAGDEGVLAVRYRSTAGNAAFARALCGLAAASGQERYSEMAREALGAAAPQAPTPMPDSTLFALAVHECGPAGETG